MTCISDVVSNNRSHIIFPMHKDVNGSNSRAQKKRKKKEKKRKKKEKKKKKKKKELDAMQSRKFTLIFSS